MFRRFRRDEMHPGLSTEYPIFISASESVHMQIRDGSVFAFEYPAMRVPYVQFGYGSHLHTLPFAYTYVSAPGVQIIPREESSQSFYRNATESSHSTRSKTKQIKKVFYDNGEDDYDDQSYEKIITKTKIEIKRRKKPKTNRGYYEIEEEEQTLSDAEVANGIYSMYVSGGSDVLMRTPKAATCMTWNGNKVKTFDGLVYTSPLSCSHTLVQDVIDGTFSVIYRACPTVDATCDSTAIEIIIDNTRFTFEASGSGLEVRSADRKVPLPIQRPELRARMLGKKLIVSMDSCAITIHWNLDQMISIEATTALWNRTGGLCGTLDQDVSNDLRSKDGTLIKVGGHNEICFESIKFVFLDGGNVCGYVGNSNYRFRSATVHRAPK